VIDEKRIWKTLKKVLEPEIDLSVVDLGLIYDVSVGDDNNVNLAMTLEGQKKLVRHSGAIKAWEKY
jgi:metal-sulfur cluster biosynthetic enzyme